jgi:hypothetical protein
METYCEANQIVHACVAVEFGRASHACESIRLMCEGLLNDVSLQPDHHHVLLIEHADVLVLEPDNEDTMRFCLYELAQLAKATNGVFVFLFDRVPGGGGGGGGGGAPSEGMSFMYRKKFMDQFSNASIYMPPPNSAFRVAHLKHLFGAHASATPLVHVQLTDGDYTTLSDLHCVDATPANMRDFVQRIFYDLSSPHPPEIFVKEEEEGVSLSLTITLASLTSPPYMTSASGSLRIIAMDPRNADNAFSVQAGRGPRSVGDRMQGRVEVPFSPSSSPPTRKHKPAAKVMPFSGKYVEGDKAKKFLKRKKRKGGEEKEEKEEEEEEDAWKE